MLNHPSYEEINLYKKLMEDVRKNPLISKQTLFDKFSVTSDLIKNNINIGETMMALSDYYRIKTLSSLADLGIKIYGSKSWVNDNYNEPYLILNYDFHKLYSLDETQHLYNSSKIGININHIQAVEAFSWRVCDIMASGACLVTSYTKNIKNYFSKANIPIFTSPYEAREICLKLLKNENMRKDIVLASNEIIDQGYRLKHIKPLIEELGKLSLNGNKSTLNVLFEEDFLIKEELNIASKVKSLKNKFLYKIWKHLDKKLRKKGIIP